MASVLRNAAPVSYTTSRPSFVSALSGDRGNQTAQMRAMGSVGTLFAIVHRLTTSEASVDWRLYRKAKSGREEDRVEVTSHAALDLWNNPNPFYDRADFVETFQQHFHLTGEAWWVITRDPRSPLPLELWPVRPDRMEPVPSTNKFLAGYVYHGPDGDIIPLELNQVQQIKYPNPLDPYRGWGAVQTILADLDSSRYSAEWNRNFFLNGAEPGGIIQVEKRLSDDEFDEMTARWREQHQGVNNAHRVAVIEQGTWVDRKFSQKDMQFAELRGVSRDVIREAFSYPKSMLGDTEDVNRANAETGEEVFARWHLVPPLSRIKRKLNGKNGLLSYYGDPSLEFDFDSPIPDSEEQENATLESKSTAAKTLVDAGYDRAAVLVTVGLPPMASTPAPELPSPVPALPAQDYVRLETWATLTEERVRIARMPTRARPMDAKPPQGTPARLSGDQLPDVSEMRTALDDALAALMAAWVSISAAQKAALVTAVRHAAEHGSLTDLIALVVDVGPAVSALAGAMARLAALAGRQVVAEAALQGVELASVAVAETEVMAVAEVTVTLLAEELKVSAARAAMAAHGSGASAADVAASVREHLDALSTANAETQFGGALHGSMNAARIASLRSGPEGAIYSQEMNDRNTCGPCGRVSGTWLGNTSDMAMVERSYPDGAYGGYVNCQGGPRCRGTIVGVWRQGQE